MSYRHNHSNVPAAYSAESTVAKIDLLNSLAKYSMTVLLPSVAVATIVADAAVCLYSPTRLELPASYKTDFTS